ncbi:MAG: L-threonylcarbamoyladenylate synthase, partial [Burkholderiaceae bacterium]
MPLTMAPMPEALEQASQVLNQGGLVVLPTETVYGLAADASQQSAVAAIYALKGRPADHPL